MIQLNSKRVSKELKSIVKLHGTNPITIYKTNEYVRWTKKRRYLLTQLDQIIPRKKKGFPISDLEKPCSNWLSELKTLRQRSRLISRPVQT